MFPPNRTGSSFYSRNLASALADRGNEIKVITTVNSEKNNDSVLKYPVIRIAAWHIPIKNFFKHLRFCSLIPRNYRFIRKTAAEFKPDAIIVVNHYLDIVFPAIYAGRKERIPLYISVGTQLQSLNKFRNRVLKFLDRLIVGRLIFPHARKIISWDKEIERYITETHRDKIARNSTIIPFGVNGDMETFNAYANSYQNTEQLLGVGAIIGHRDYIYQLRVFSQLLKRYPSLTFKIIGNQYIDKPIRYAKELGISDRVIFTGELPHDKVLEEYQNSLCHWMMLVGEYVGLGTSTLEAMLMGVPIISNVPENLFGFGELRDMENYIRTDGKNVTRDVGRIGRLIENPEERKRIGTNEKRFVSQYLNWDNVAKEFEHIIQNNRTDQ